jgi:hypothetical protein
MDKRCSNYTVCTESIRTAESISRENGFFKTLPLIELSVEFNKCFSKVNIRVGFYVIFWGKFSTTRHVVFIALRKYPYGREA